MDKLRDLIYGIVGALMVAAVGYLASVSVEIRDSVRSLEQYHASEWPLERQILSFETAQLNARVDSLEAALEKLQREVSGQ